MSIVNNLLNATNGMTKSNANVKINLGNGHSNITVTAATADIDTGCGDQVISAVTSGDLKIDTGHCGYDSINAIAGGNVKISTYEDDDDITLVTAGNFDIDAGEDTHECEDRGATWTDNDKVKVISTKTDGQNYVKLGKGDDNATVIAHNTNVQKDEGTMVLGSMGNNLKVDSDATINIIGYWGNDAEFNFYQKESYNDVRTMDYWINDGSDGKYVVNSDGSSGDKSLKDMTEIRVNKADEVMTLKEYDDKYNSEYVNYFKDNFSDFMNTATYQGTEELVTSKTELIGSTTDTKSNVNDLIKKYNLDATQAAALRSVDLSAKREDGLPKYSIVKSQRYNGYVVVENTGEAVKKSYGYRVSEGRLVSNGKILQSKRNDNTAYTLYDNQTVTASTTNTTETYRTTVDTLVRDVFYTGGLSGLTLNQHKGQLNGFFTIDDGNVNINKCDNTNNCQIDNIRVEAGKIYTVDVDHKTEVTDFTKLITNISKIINGEIFSPLVLDMNHDGKVSATAGQGVDINNDGKVDGAATNGDKMLAMTDINGNGKVDGSEVFGNMTVSPFTKKALNAKNGFEALKMIAQEAEEYTGISCMDGSKVNVKNLEQALAKVGVKLGFVSDNNAENVEDLYGVSSIEVGNYTESERTNADVQNLQHSTFTDENGNEYNVDDVWFKG